MPDDVDTVEQTVQVVGGGAREIERNEVDSFFLQGFACPTIPARRAHRLPLRGQKAHGVGAEPAGAAGDERLQHLLHSRRIMPPTVTPAAVPISMSRWPGRARPVRNASCNAVGIEAAT